MTIRETLISMGYREVKSGHWIKPVGYVAFSYHEGKNEWTNYFRSAQGKIERWETKPLEGDQVRFGTYLQQLKGLECWTRTCEKTYMKYVVAGKKIASCNDGIYCKFLNLPNWQRGSGGQCVWGKLPGATFFDTPEEANQAMVGYPHWVENCDAVVAAIHPLNISH